MPGTLGYHVENCTAATAPGTLTSSRSHTAVGEKRAATSTAAPTAAGVYSALTMPWMWCSGSTCSSASEGCMRQADTREPTWACRDLAARGVGVDGRVGDGGGRGKGGCVRVRECVPCRYHQLLAATGWT